MGGLFPLAWNLLLQAECLVLEEARWKENFWPRHLVNKLSESQTEESGRAAQAGNPADSFVVMSL